MHLKAYRLQAQNMDAQHDFDLDTAVSSKDMAASYVPASFDDYLLHRKMRHTGSRPNTKLKLQSDYDLSRLM
jgi:hypothetical protein